MTSELVSQLSTRISAVEQKVEKGNAAMGEMGKAVSRMEALLEANLQRTADERSALFESRSEHERRLSSIERDYVPRSEHEKARDEQIGRNRDVDTRIDGMGEKIAALQTRVAQIIVVATVGWAVIQVAFKFLWK